MNAFSWLTMCTGGMFFGILLLMWAGRHIGGQIAKRNTHANTGFSALEGALFGLMGLILAFSFSGAAARLDTRRQLIVDEANCIGTAYLRLILLPAEKQTELRDMFREYVDIRLAACNTAPGSTKGNAVMSRSAALQNQIWTKAAAASQQMSTTQAAILLLPALNAMFDIANTHEMAKKMHPPEIIYILMIVLILICSLLAGFQMGFGKTRSFMHIVAFAVLLTITVYTIIDLEYPRLGFLNVKSFDQVFIDLKNSM